MSCTIRPHGGVVFRLITCAAVLALVVGTSTVGIWAQVDFAAGVFEALRRQRAGGQKPLLLFGGDNDETFLGCLTCSEVERDSVLNDVGRFGSSVLRMSIRNKV